MAHAAGVRGARTAPANAAAIVAAKPHQNRMKIEGRVIARSVGTYDDVRQMIR
jgi:hypothetical protein